ncbi:UDP-glucuronic acid decarboxylase 1 [Papilio machaon]|uniref:UDP-glucuronic acid decarboxylase 1 n=1 Tax=Papilio machaon TaxID=76193 RepID=A0A0N1PI56_PAPMA|nr:UDP-glucuronic acid decarboxylase 1 [Papilio machaon]
MASSYSLPVNIGNPVEHTIEEFAVIIKNLVPGCRSTVATGAAVEDDPQRRRPDITLAEKHLHCTVATGAAVEDDPQRRRPDITLAEKHLHWSPKVGKNYEFPFAIAPSISLSSHTQAYTIM